MNEEEETTLYPDSYDRYNDRHGRNIDNTDGDSYNCGGYALETYIWEEPTDCVDAYDVAYNVDYADECDEDGYDRFMTEFLEEATRDMIAEFEGRLERISYDDIFQEKTKNSTIVAFRIACNVETYIDGDDSEDGSGALTFDIDFHFAKRKDGHWTEKMGAGVITDSEFTDMTILEPWDHEYYNYNSPVAFFILHPVKKLAA